MTSTQKIIDQELAQFGWYESLATNSISDFKSPTIDVEAQTTKEKGDFIDKFVCHLIFYMIFCYSLFLYIFIDLGFASFLKNKVNTLLRSKNLFELPLFISSLSN